MADSLLNDSFSDLDSRNLWVSFDIDMPDPSSTSPIDLSNENNPGAVVGHAWITIGIGKDSVSFGFYSGAGGDKDAKPLIHPNSAGEFRLEQPGKHSTADVSVIDYNPSEAEFTRLRQFLVDMLRKSNKGLLKYCLNGREGNGNCASTVLDALEDYVDRKFAGRDTDDPRDNETWFSPAGLGHFLRENQEILAMLGLHTQDMFLLR